MRRIARPIVLLSVLWCGAGAPSAHAQVLKAEADAKRARAEAEAERAATRRAVIDAVRNAEARTGTTKLVIRRPVVANIRIPVFGKGDFQNLNASARQLLPHYRPMLAEEYLFARRVCGLSPEERKEIALEGERALRAAVLDLATYGITQRFMGSTSPPQPVRVIREALAKALKERLSADRWEVYERARKERESAYRRSIVNHLVAQFDGELLLSATQREEIRGLLSQRIEEQWDEYTNGVAAAGHGFLVSAPPSSTVDFDVDLRDRQREFVGRNPQVFQSMGPTGLLVRVIASGPHQFRMNASPAGNLNLALGGNLNGGGAAVIEIEELVEAEKAVGLSGR